MTQAVEQAAKKTPVEKAHSYMALASTSIAVLGAVGTAVAWIAGSFYTGDVVIRPDKNVESMVVKVFDRKGQESTFYCRQFPLMPGQYHLEITLPKNEVHSADATIKFGKSAVIPVAVTGKDSPAIDSADGIQRHHWWQVWRRKTDKQGS